MKGWLSALVLLLIVYALSGFYVVRGNEQAVVRRFGKVQRKATDEVALLASGLHYTLPWPFSRVDRVNLNEMRTITIGVAEEDDFSDTAFLETIDPTRKSQFLTGDKNILNLQIAVHYRVSEAAADEFLFRSASAEQHLRMLVEGIAADLIGRSGVDFVHPLGLGQLRELLTAKVRDLAEQARLGVEIEEVAINSVYPPIRVKSHFLDVSNARADKEKQIHEARAYAEQRQADGRAEARRLLDEAEIYGRETVESARGRADSFTRVVAEFREQEQRGERTYAQARQLALRRRYFETMEEILGRVSGKVLLESGQPVDLTIFRDGSE